MTTTTIPQPQEGPAMFQSTADQFLTDREVWVAAGRPADMSYAHWAGVVAAAADREAEARGYVEPAPVVPLVSFG